MKRSIGLVLLCCWFGAVCAQQGLVIPEGAELALMDGEIDLCCLDVTVAGVLSGDGATIGKLRNLTIEPSGTLVAPNSEIRISGVLDNQGQVIGGSSIFRRVTDCINAALPIPALSAPALVLLLLLILALAKRGLRRYDRPQW